MHDMIQLINSTHNKFIVYCLYLPSALQIISIKYKNLPNIIDNIKDTNFIYSLFPFEVAP